MAEGENVHVVGMVPAVRSSLEVAIWFFDRAQSANRPLDALTLQQFLYLAQTEYAKNNNGRKLMPATFLAANTGPLEPTVYHVFERGRPDIRNPHTSFGISNFLMDIWNRYSLMPAGELTLLVNDDLHYRHAFDQGRNHEISVTALRVVQQEPEEEPVPEMSADDAPKTFMGEDNFVGLTSSGKRATKWTPKGTKDSFRPKDEPGS
jgi:uncharacterized phage-associated protein